MLPRSLSARLAVAGVALAAVAAPVAQASDHDQRVADLALLRQWDLSIPSGQVQHEVWDFTVAGSHPQHTRTEWWARADHRWYARTTNVDGGKTIVRAFGDAHGTVSLYAVGPEPVLREPAGPPPQPGWNATYDRVLAQRGTIVQVGERAVAGIQGAVFEPAPDRVTTDPAAAAPGMWTTDDAGMHTQLVFEAGTFQPLERTTTSADGGFRQDEALLTRELLPASQAPAQLTSGASARAVRAAKRHLRRH